MLLSLQLEAGYVTMTKPVDDLYVQYALPNTVNFNSFAFGAAINAVISERFSVSVGWRNLGDQHIDAEILPDAEYYACRPKCPPGTSYWRGTGNIQQAYVEAGYRFHLGSFSLIPSIGIAEDRINWHVYASSAGHTEQLKSQEQTHPGAFGGISLEKGRWGFGLYYLDTTANGRIDPAYPAQSHHAGYARITYRFH